MLKTIIQAAVLLTLVQTNDLPELRLPVIIVLAIALSLRIVNKWSRNNLTTKMFFVMVFNALSLFYLLLIAYKNWGIEKNPIVEAFLIGVLSNEIVNEVIKIASIGFKKWLVNWANLIAAKHDSNRIS